MTDRMRAQFEQRFPLPPGVFWNSVQNTYVGEAGWRLATDRWEAWQESRASLVVEWLDQHTYTVPDVAGAAILDCRTAFSRAGAQTPETASAFRALLAERNSLAYLLKRFVDGEHDQDENQAERHMYHDEAQTLLAYLGGEAQGHTLVPDEILRKQYEQRTALIAENETLVATAQSLRDEWRKDQADAARYRWIEPVFAGLFGIASLDAHIDAAMINESVATQSTDNENVSRHEGGQT